MYVSVNIHTHTHIIYIYIYNVCIKNVCVGKILPIMIMLDCEMNMWNRIYFSRVNVFLTRPL